MANVNFLSVCEPERGKWGCSLNGSLPISPSLFHSGELQEAWVWNHFVQTEWNSGACVIQKELLVIPRWLESFKVFSQNSLNLRQAFPWYYNILTKTQWISVALLTFVCLLSCLRSLEHESSLVIYLVILGNRKTGKVTENPYYSLLLSNSNLRFIANTVAEHQLQSSIPPAHISHRSHRHSLLNLPWPAMLFFHSP